MDEGRVVDVFYLDFSKTFFIPIDKRMKFKQIDGVSRYLLLAWVNTRK